MKSFYRFILFISIVILLSSSGCKVKYSLTGGTIHPDAETVSILHFPNRASLVQPNLSQLFTDALRERFNSQTRLSQVPGGGDYHIEGEITEYKVTPVAITGGETAAKNRLTVTINVRFTNNFDEKQNFETRFTRYTDFDSSLNLIDIEEALIGEINEALVDDIFNKSVVNW